MEERRRRAALDQSFDDDPDWVVELPDDPALDRVAEAIGALANGLVGLRGAREEDGPGTGPLFVANGVYDGDDPPRLLEGPVWTGLDVRGAGTGGRRLDLRNGVLVRADAATGFRSVRFVSVADLSCGALRAEAPAEVLEPAGTPEVTTARATAPGGGGIAVAVRDRWQEAGDRRVVERLAAWSVDPDHDPSIDDACRRLHAAEAAGFDRLLAEHRAEWARRWDEAGVEIEGSPGDQLAARFAVFNLLGVAPDEGEAAVGPRGLTGHGYGGHVFWDADVYVLPALAAIRPPAARAMLEYRIRRLPAAHAAAAELGLDGARFPWESARDGTDVTPREIRTPDGTAIPVRTAEQEEHIVADVAWAAHEYAAWTGEQELLEGPGRALVVDTARYWASRVRVDDAGRGHLDDVMGPDEYHEAVDDNAYTNVMARWNLRRGAELLERTGGDPAVAARWRALADAIVDGWDEREGCYEQFAGYWELEPLLADHIAPRPFAADLLLGAPRVAASQLIKQPDVLMLHHLVPDEVRPGSLPANLAFYEPRTSHGSSLSPAIHASLFARAGDPERALELFRLAARLDLDDVTGTTASGLHLATMGGLWQSLAYGFLGLRPRADHLEIDPCLPAEWQALGLRFRFRGAPLRIRAEHGEVHVGCDEPVPVRVAGGPLVVCEPPGRSFRVDRPADRRLERSLR